jgi:hypothetical protein
MIFLDDADRDGERQIIQRWTSEFSNLIGSHVDCEKGLFKATWFLETTRH